MQSSNAAPGSDAVLAGVVASPDWLFAVGVAPAFWNGVQKAEPVSARRPSLAPALLHAARPVMRAMAAPAPNLAPKLGFENFMYGGSFPSRSALAAARARPCAGVRRCGDRARNARDATRMRRNRLSQAKSGSPSWRRALNERDAERAVFH